MAFISRSGTRLTLAGQPFYFTGFNLPYQMHDGESLSTALANWGVGKGGPAVFRTFCFQTYSVAGAAINWTTLDNLLATCASYGVHVILVLGNNYGDEGGPNDDGALKDLAWWQGGYSSVIQSGSNPAQVVTYRNWVEQIVTRYANNETIAMWQLVNEAQAINDDNSASETSAYNAMAAFANDVAAMVKSIDQNHLVSLGNCLGYNGTGGQWVGSNTNYPPPAVPAVGTGDYQLLLSNQYLDVGDFRDYGYPTYPMGIPDATTGNGTIGLDGALAIGATVNKPIIVGEDGIDWTSSATRNPPISPNTLAERATLFQAQFTARFAAGVAGNLIWSWRNNPQVPDGLDYGSEVGPSDPALAIMAPSAYVPRVSRVGMASAVTASASSVTINYTATTGNLLFVTCISAISAYPSVSDGVNTYTLIGSNNWDYQVWYAKNIHGGPLNIVFSGGTAAWAAQVIEFSGASTTAPIASENDTGNSSSGATATATSTFDYVIGFQNIGAATALSPSITSRTFNSALSGQVDELVVKVTGSSSCAAVAISHGPIAGLNTEAFSATLSGYSVRHTYCALIAAAPAPVSTNPLVLVI
jgi:hypothetical protein